MKYALIGDIHGAALGDLETALKSEDLDVLICTSDFDQAKTIRDFMDLEKRLQSEGKAVIAVAGNHDHDILNCIPISSETMVRQGKTSYQLHEELKADPVAWEYLDELVNSKASRVRIYLDHERFGREFRTIIIHGAYDGSLRSYPSCPPELRDLWMRLDSEEDYRKNFAVMATKPYKLMIRGHDHEPAYVYQDPVKDIVKYIPNQGNSHRLFKHRMHTINPGALFDGRFAIIDTRNPGEDIPLLRFFQL